jgi:hypothetical protein
MSAENGSTLELSGGKLILKDSDTPGAPVVINGTCKNFIMEDGAVLSMYGTAAPSTIGASTGGDAKIALSITGTITIDDSEICLYGGSGYSKPTPGAATNEALVDHQYAGGNASLILELSRYCSKNLNNSSIELIGGSGGNAADAQTGTGLDRNKGGGYSNGGHVGGRVGSGGLAEFRLDSPDDVELNGVSINITGGTGGCSGDGNLSVFENGGGGGGYSGGDGGVRNALYPELAAGKPGGAVDGHVGAGGNATLELITGSSFSFLKCTIKINGGSGGSAGPHQSYALEGSLGGSGGQGYSGGGGGAGYSSLTGSITTTGGSG